MKIKLGVLENSVNSISNLLKEKLPVQISHSLVRFTKKAGAELEIYSNQQVEILKKYGAKANGERGLVLTQEDEGFQQAMVEITTLRNIEVDIEFTKIKIEDLGDIKVSGEDLIILSFLFEDEDGKKE